MKTQTQTATLRPETRSPSKRKSKTQNNGGTAVMNGTDSSSSSSPSYDDIAARAYAIWNAQGCPQGREKEHWQQAQEELTAGTTSQKA
jgi:hypothetical protein